MIAKLGNVQIAHICGHDRRFRHPPTDAPKGGSGMWRD